MLHDQPKKPPAEAVEAAEDFAETFERDLPYHNLTVGYAANKSFLAGWEQGAAKLEAQLTAEREKLRVAREALADCIHTLEHVDEPMWVKGSIVVARKVLAAIGEPTKEAEQMGRGE